MSSFFTTVMTRKQRKFFPKCRATAGHIEIEREKAREAYRALLLSREQAGRKLDNPDPARPRWGRHPDRASCTCGFGRPLGDSFCRTLKCPCYAAGRLCSKACSCPNPTCCRASDLKLYKPPVAINFIVRGKLISRFKMIVRNMNLADVKNKLATINANTKLVDKFKNSEAMLRTGAPSKKSFSSEKTRTANLEDCTKGLCTRTFSANKENGYLEGDDSLDNDMTDDDDVNTANTIIVQPKEVPITPTLATKRRLQATTATCNNLNANSAAEPAESVTTAAAGNTSSSLAQIFTAGGILASALLVQFS